MQSVWFYKAIQFNFKIFSREILWKPFFTRKKSSRGRHVSPSSTREIGNEPFWERGHWCPVFFGKSRDEGSGAMWQWTSRWIRISWSDEYNGSLWIGNFMLLEAISSTQEFTAQRASSSAARHRAYGWVIATPSDLWKSLPVFTLAHMNLSLE